MVKPFTGDDHGLDGLRLAVFRIVSACKGLVVLGGSRGLGREMPSRMLKTSASGVLASLRDSTYQSVRLASSLAAALLDGHFEHPVSDLYTVVYRKRSLCFERESSVSAACYVFS
ncbi:hypothetical protein ACO9S2_01325 [Nitrospira sp. NS4]|uniref:hypothetical protein n=1 Tax=Nitrospira sp. NS4 TaxID=3414498 RepID=UPI003C2CA774